MPAARILADTSGRLSVPDEPIIPVVPGDGAGADGWRASVRLLELAVEKAYRGKRRLRLQEFAAGERGLKEFNDPTPPATVNAFRMYRVGLNGGQRPGPDGAPTLGGELRALLDLHVQLVLLRRPAALPAPVAGGPAELLLGIDLGEATRALLELPAGSSRAMRLTRTMAAELPAALASLRFGTVDAVDRYQEEQDGLPVGMVDAAMALQPVSRLGTERLVLAAVRLARQHGRERVLFAHDAVELPALAEARRVAMRLALEALPANERVALDDVRAATLPARLGQLGAALVAAPEAEGLRLVTALGPAFGGAQLAATGAFNLETGHAVFGPWRPDGEAANPLPLLGAMRLMLVHLGWGEAAAVLDAAMERALAAGQLPTAVAARAGRPDGLGANAFAAAVLASFA